MKQTLLCYGPKESKEIHIRILTENTINYIPRQIYTQDFSSTYRCFDFIIVKSNLMFFVSCFFLCE